MLLIYEMQLATFEAFRRLGFAPDDIFVAYNLGIPVTILRTQGKQFVLGYPDAAASVPIDEIAYIRGWQEAVIAWNSTMTDTERQNLFTDRFVECGEVVPLLDALMRKGITWQTSERLN